MSNLCNVLRGSSSKLSIVFEYGPDAKQRLFTFNRDCKESLDTLAKRMKINLQKAFGGDKKANNQNNKAEDVRIEFRLSGQDCSIGDLAAIQNGDFWKNGSQMIINGRQYVVRINCPFIADIRLSAVILAGYLTYPYVDMQHGRLAQSKFVWYRQPFKCAPGTEWTEIDHLGFTYPVTVDDLPCRLKVVCTPRNETQEEGIAREAISTEPIRMGPRRCPFEERFIHTKPVPEPDRFRVVSYNLLADLYADSEYSRDVLYSYCQNSFLDFRYRKPLLVKELLGYHGDLYFLQEVDAIFYERVLEPLFEINGFGSHFAAKERKSEGLAILYDQRKFHCVRQESHTHSDLLFNDDEMFGFLRQRIEQNQQLMDRIKKLKNSFQMLVVESPTDPTRMILLCNLHLYSKDDADHIRLFQAYITFHYVDHQCQKILADRPDCRLAVIISGDFNSTPEWGVAKLAQNGQVDHTLEDFQSNPDEVIQDFHLEHRLQLGSACGFPPYTHYAQHFNGCLDYIWYDTVRLTVTDIVPMPSHDEVVRETALPNETIPSDHLPLICTLEWKT